MHSNRLAIAAGTIVAIAATLIATFVLFLFVKSFFEPAQSAAVDEVCLDSAILRANLLKIPGESLVFNLPKLQCPQSEINLITNDDDKVKNKDNKYISKNYQQEVQNVIAEEMFKCWNKLGDGKIEFLGAKGYVGNLQCVLCSTISISPNLKAKLANVNNFEVFLEQNEVPFKGKSYADYFGDNLVYNDKDDLSINIQFIYNQDKTINSDLAIIYGVLTVPDVGGLGGEELMRKFLSGCKDNLCLKEASLNEYWLPVKPLGQFGEINIRTQNPAILTAPLQDVSGLCDSIIG